MPSDGDVKQTSTNEAERLSRLAQDYDRWGLAPEAEVARLRYRKLIVRDMATKQAVSGRRVRDGKEAALALRPAG